MRKFLVVMMLASLSGGSFSVLAQEVSGVAEPQAVRAGKPVEVKAVLDGYATIVSATYEDTLFAARGLQEAVNQFVAKPSAEGLLRARKAWLAAREVYGQTEAFRFYGGPIDDKNGPEGRINAWPMDESFVDAVKGKSDSGLINNPKFVITKASLSAQNERGGEENIATGWHAIEFLLWGQDVSEAGPGDRSFEDFVDGKAKHADRRRLYLKTVTALLVDDLALVNKQWLPRVKTNYRAKFEKGGLESVRKIFIGLGSLSRGELAGERMEVALASQHQEDEQSCFSDNTHRDIINNAIGIQNVWSGTYKKLNGDVVKVLSLSHFVAAKDVALADKTTEQIALSVKLASEIQAPFDRESVGGKDAPGRLRIQATVDSLIAQSKSLVLSANAVGITKLTLSENKK